MRCHDVTTRFGAGFALLPVVFAAGARSASSTALLLESGAVEHGIAITGSAGDALGYAAEAGYAHAKALLGSRSGCSGLPTLPTTSFAQATYAATLTPGASTPSTTYSFVIGRGRLARVRATRTPSHATEKDLKAKNKSGNHTPARAAVRFEWIAARTSTSSSATLILYVKNDDDDG